MGVEMNLKTQYQRRMTIEDLKTYRWVGSIRLWEVWMMEVWSIWDRHLKVLGRTEIIKGEFLDLYQRKIQFWGERYKP